MVQESARTETEQEIAKMKVIQTASREFDEMMKFAAAEEDFYNQFVESAKYIQGCVDDR